MLTGRQIYKACRLVGMTTPGLAQATNVAYARLLAIKDSDNAAGIDFLGLSEVRRVLETRGAEFYLSEDGVPDARLRPRDKPCRPPRI